MRPASSLPNRVDLQIFPGRGSRGAVYAWISDGPKREEEEFLFMEKTLLVQKKKSGVVGSKQVRNVFVNRKQVVMNNFNLSLTTTTPLYTPEKKNPQPHNSRLHTHTPSAPRRTIRPGPFDASVVVARSRCKCKHSMPSRRPPGRRRSSAHTNDRSARARGGDSRTTGRHRAAEDAQGCVAPETRDAGGRRRWGGRR